MFFGYLQDEKELIKNLAQNICNGSEAVVVADEYLNPGRMPSQHTLNTPVDTPLAPSTPTQKFTFPPPGGSQQAPPSYHTAVNGGGSTVGRGGVGYPPSNRHSTRYNSSHAINEGFSTMGPMGSRSLQRHSNFFSTSCDPLKLLGKLEFHFALFIVHFVYPPPRNAEQLIDPSGAKGDNPV